MRSGFNINISCGRDQGVLVALPQQEVCYKILVGLNGFDPRTDFVLGSVRIDMSFMNLVTVISMYTRSRNLNEWVWLIAEKYLPLLFLPSLILPSYKCGAAHQTWMISRANCMFMILYCYTQMASQASCRT